MQPVDLSFNVGGDLQISPSGDLQTAGGVIRSQQRVLRRLLTPQGDYIWNIPYGAGLPGLVGQPVSPSTIEALVRAQMRLEPSVVQSPPPTVTVQSNNDGSVFVYIVYAERDTGQTQTLSFPVG